LKDNRLIKPTYPHPKTTRRNFGTLNLRIKQRLSYGKKRGKFTGKELDPETGLYYFGARYLDPKTSRWLSGDPAVGEYFPVAPVNDEARKRNGNLPGMGGVFNYVNLHVYHYAGNNPVKLVDPDGKTLGIHRLDTLAESKFVGEVLGPIGEYLFQNADFFKIPGNSSDSGVSLPNRRIGLGSDISLHPMSSTEGRNTLVHEVFHQIQYERDPRAWERLRHEFKLDNNGVNVYFYGNLSKYSRLEDILFHEARATMVGDFAALYYDARYGNGLLDSEKTKIKDMVRILEGSFISTEATQWVKDNL
jgi:RHS repeat-associated protein